MSNLIQPVVAVGAVVFRDDCVLLVKRRHPPNQGQWAIPGGKVNLGESLAEAAEREIREETGITIRAGEPIYTFEVIQKDLQGKIQYHYVVTDLRADYLSGQPSSADDVTAAEWIDRKTFTTLIVNQITKELLQEKYNFPGKLEQV